MHELFGLLKAAIRGRRPEVRWHDHWNSSLDETLSVLPSPEFCPPELLREMFEVCPAPKRVARVDLAGEPLALVPLTFTSGIWKPIATWVLPGTLFPARAGQEIRALAALQMPVFVGWWRQDDPPPIDPAICERRDVPAHRLVCVEEDELYWCKSGLLKTVRRARKRCAHLHVEINRRGAAHWTIDNWGRLWARSGFESVPDTPVRLAVARFWEPLGRHVTVSLIDGDEIVASATLFVQGRDLIGMCNYRRRDYDRFLIGTRLFDAVHQWALGNRIATIDFGSSHDYKNDWAPEAGTKSELVVAASASLPKRALQAVKQRL